MPSVPQTAALPKIPECGSCVKPAHLYARTVMAKLRPPGDRRVSVPRLASTKSRSFRHECWHSPQTQTVVSSRLLLAEQCPAAGMSTMKNQNELQSVGIGV